MKQLVMFLRNPSEDLNKSLSIKGDISERRCSYRFLVILTKETIMH